MVSYWALGIPLPGMMFIMPSSHGWLMGWYSLAASAGRPSWRNKMKKHGQPTSLSDKHHLEDSLRFYHLMSTQIHQIERGVSQYGLYTFWMAANWKEKIGQLWLISELTSEFTIQNFSHQPIPATAPHWQQTCQGPSWDYPPLPQRLDGQFVVPLSSCVRIHSFTFSAILWKGSTTISKLKEPCETIQLMDDSYVRVHDGWIPH